ncbi:MAG: DUF493 domain-containing protein [Bacteriovoracales bacterium]|nr:DUF493 domain-containing protein [Bacteriovoracales bacterium]
MEKSDDLNFKALLEKNYHFPCHYLFKFVLPMGKRGELMAILGQGEVVKERPSRTGRYIGLTFSRMFQSSDEILSVYRAAGRLKGVMAL